MRWWPQSGLCIPPPVFVFVFVFVFVCVIVITIIKEICTGPVQLQNTGIRAKY